VVLRRVTQRVVLATGAVLFAILNLAMNADVRGMLIDWMMTAAIFAAGLTHYYDYAAVSDSGNVSRASNATPPLLSR